jgi:hypothetical protein
VRDEGKICDGDHRLHVQYPAELVERGTEAGCGLCLAGKIALGIVEFSTQCSQSSCTEGLWSTCDDDDGGRIGGRGGIGQLARAVVLDGLV